MIGHGLIAIVIACTGSLVAGFLVELFCVFWTHSFTKLSAGWTGLYSMAMATCLLAGIGQSVSLAIAAPFFVIGHGAGAYFGVVVVKIRKDATQARKAIRGRSGMFRARARRRRSIGRRAVIPSPPCLP